MKNMMKEYLGNEYSDNHLKNFCLYWIKAFESRPSFKSEDEWRMKNDLDCLYFDEDLKADTLMSAWTPIKWVVNYLNRDIDIVFSKPSKKHSDPYHDVKLLLDNGELFLSPEHELVKLLYRFLELAELRCNFILLPARKMNSDRYKIMIENTWVWLCDEVPATLAHLFDPLSLGKYFPDKASIVKWIRREHLEMGFEDGKIDLYHVKPLIKGLDPYTPLWAETEKEITSALEYMIDFLENRMKILTDIENGLVIEEGVDKEVYFENISETIGDICVSHITKGYDKVPWSIKTVFKKMFECEEPENIDSIDFLIKGDISDDEVNQIEGCINRLSKWYSRGDEIKCRWKCQKDENMSKTCEVSAILHLKKHEKIAVPMKNSLKEDELVRPEGITSDLLWELYKLFHNMYRTYLWVDMSNKNDGKYRLFLIEEATLGNGKTYYGADGLGVELPWSREEWIDLKLRPLYEKGGTRSFRIKIDTIIDRIKTIERILEKNHVKLPQL